MIQTTRWPLTGVKPVKNWIRTTVATGGVFCIVALVIALVVVQGLHAPKAQAATLGTLNFQARLQTNPGGAIVPDGYYNVEFKLYNASSSSGSSQGSCTGDANCLWTETWYDSNGVTAGNDNRVRVSHGYLTVNLGSLTSFPTTINWDQNLYITMNIGGSTQTATPTWNGEMSPRLALTAVPYAFKAGQLATYNSGNGFTSTLALLQPTVGSQVFQIQDQGAGGTYNICIQNSSACGFATGSGTAFLQNGNSFGTTAVLGANDANALQFKAGNATVLTFSSGATDAYFGNASATGTASAPTNFTLNGTGSSTAGTTGGKLTLKGGAGSSSGTGSDGGDVSLLGGTAGGSNARVGGQISITGGTGSATGSGGAINLLSGAGGATSGGSGALSLQTGTTTSGNTGGISLLTGNATGGTAGDINIDIGTSTTGAGSINIGTTNGTSTAKTITIGNTGQVGTIKLGQSTATNTISIGSANTATGNTQTINIGAGTPAGTGKAALVLGNTSNASSVVLNAGSGNITLNTNNSSGGTVVKSVTSNSATAFQVQDASSNQILAVDTAGAQTFFGKASTVNAKLVLQNSTNANTVTIQSGVTSGSGYILTLPTALGSTNDCLKDTGSGALGFGNCVSTIGTFSSTSIANGASISGNTLTLGVGDATNPGMISTTTQTIAGSKTFTGTTTTISGALSLGGTISGAGLTDCQDTGGADGYSSVEKKLVYNGTSQQFACASDGTTVVIRKSANEAISSSTLQDDDHLQFAIGANEKWTFEMVMDVATTTSSNYRFQIVGPTGITCNFSSFSYDYGGSSGGDAANTGCSSAVTVANSGSAGGFTEYVYGSVSNGSTAGTVKLQWARPVSGTVTEQAGSTQLKAYKVAGADYAETYFTKDKALAAGDVVGVDGSLQAGVTKATKAYQNDMIGIVSTQPGYVVGDAIGAAQGRPVPIALNGRVPVKIASDSEPIEAGDSLTSSATQPGKATKATRAGQMLGTAMLPWKPGLGQDTVLAFVKLGWGDPGQVDAGDQSGQAVSLQQQSNQLGNNLNVDSLQTVSLKVTGDATVEGSMRIGGTLSVATLQLAGHIITAGNAPRVDLQQSAGITDTLVASADSKLARVGIKGNDISGTITITTGDQAQAGQLIKLTFVKQYGDVPQIVLTPIGRDSAQLQAYVDSPSNDGFLLGTVGQPAPGGTYRFTYQVLQ